MHQNTSYMTYHHYLFNNYPFMLMLVTIA